MRRSVPVFTNEQIDLLIALNRRLRQLEYWCLLRAKCLVQDFKRVRGASDVWVEGEDFELESQIGYYRCVPSHGAQEELILQTDFLSMPPFKHYYLNPTPEQAADIFRFLHYNWYDGLEGIPRLNQECICWSFHELHDHHGLDWQQVLEIERVWLDVHAIHQVETAIRQAPGNAILTRPF